MAEAPGMLDQLLQQLGDELKARGIALPGVITGQWGTLGRYIRGGWRSAGAWVCILGIFVNTVVLQLARLWGLQVEPPAWEGIAALVGALGVFTHYRSKDLQAGVTT